LSSLIAANELKHFRKA